MKEKLKNLPTSPGVYLMKDSHGEIMYVGKAKNLNRRVRSYFQNSKSHSQKIKKMVSSIRDFDYLLTDTEFEAFLLECHYIQELKPIFNKQMKSPESYTYILIQIDENGEPTGLKTTCQRNEQDGNIYFGPYSSKSAVDKAIQGLKEFFKIDCKNFSKRKSPCINFSLGLCLGVCLGGLYLKEYQARLKKIISIINDSDSSILEDLQQKMMAAAEHYHFEAAAKYKEYGEAIRYLIYKEKVIDFAFENRLFVVVEYLNDEAFKLFLIKANTVLFSAMYRIQDNIDLLVESIKQSIFTTLKNSQQTNVKVLKSDEVDQAQIIYRYVTSKQCKSISIRDDDKLEDKFIYKLLSPHE
ncbi:GIY-YIG nuclease family protein [Bacillus sp. JJ1764]|uniref:GIY-YIG nuclease family protein n=1 Tax=Bacillus sp. JJ1764 TaxID=3122964 RepID=UPI002FFD6829